MRSLFAFILLLGPALTAWADTIIPGGEVSGDWTADGSPYLVQGDITVPPQDTLRIHPGVEVRFNRDTGLQVQGHLWSDGTLQSGVGDTIIFTSAEADPQPGDWDGIGAVSGYSFIGTLGDFRFCAFEFGDRVSSYYDTLKLADCRVSMLLGDYSGTVQADRCLFTEDPYSIQLPHLLRSCLFQGSLDVNPDFGDTYLDSCVIEGDLSYGFGSLTATDCRIAGQVNGLIYTDQNNSLLTRCLIEGDYRPASGTLSACTVFGNVYGAEAEGSEAYSITIRDSSVIFGRYLSDSEGNSLSNSVFHDSLVLTRSVVTGVRGCTVYGSLVCEGHSMFALDAEVENNRFFGGGIHVYGEGWLPADSVFISGNLVADSPADGIRISYASGTDSLQAEIRHNTVVNAAGHGIRDQILGLASHSLTLVNNIITGSGGYGIYSAGYSSAQARYNDVWDNVWGDYQGLEPGIGSLSVDPLFVNPDSGDYHLQSVAGSWHGGQWLPDPLHSPAIDAGDPASDWQLEPAPNGGRVNLGFEGNTPQASLSSALPVWDSGMDIPQEFRLFGVHPNPFNPSTVARYELQAASHVSLKVYDTAGREVRTLVDGWRVAGSHEITFNASGLPSGLYLARLQAGDFTQTQKLVLLK